MDKINLTDLQKDALQELANIGAGNASTALSQMVNKTIHIGIPRIDIVDITQATEIIHDEGVVIGIFMRIPNGIPSYLLLIIPEKSAFLLAGLLTGEPPQGDILSEMDQSALQEVANVMICAFFDSISELLNISITPSPPHLAYDISDAVMDYILIQIGQTSNDIIVFNVDIKEEKKTQFSMHMCLLPESNSVKVILEKLDIEKLHMMQYK